MMKNALVSMIGVVGVALLFAACGSDDKCGSPGSSGTLGDGEAGQSSSGTSGSGGGAGAGSEQAGASSGGDGPTSAAVPALPSNFEPSNLPTDLDLQVEDDLIFSGETCATEARIDTDKGEIRCYSPGLEERAPRYAFKLVEQSDGTELAVFAGKNIVADPNVQINVVGQRALVLLAPGNITLRGPIYAIADTVYASRANSGGFSASTGMNVKGLGPGGGSGSAPQAGGASFCGLGGKGGGATGAPGGLAYGTTELIPLVGGSSGGSAYTEGGAGGGALQIVAGGSLLVGPTGVLHVGGSSGGWHSSGGGSGGAILLEASDISIEGTLAANGGGGGEGTANGDDGFRASPDASPAPGGNTGTEATDDDGGNGAAGTEPNGAAGSAKAGGGGGGAGRIRLNSKSGKADISGTLSPAETTECVSEGKLGG